MTDYVPSKPSWWETPEGQAYLATPEGQAQLRTLILAEDAARYPLPSLDYCPHLPTERQALFLECLRQPKATEGPTEGLYGGAAGGGKSDALLMAALEYVHVPGYAALILRKTYEDLALPGAIMDRGQDWLRPTDAHPHDGGKSWTFPSGASLTFSYLENAADMYRYQGAEFQFIGIDELTQWEERPYRYLRSRVRRPATGPLSKVPLRLASASNPGGAGHEWVNRRFLIEGRLFVPAKLTDNPHLDQVAYRAGLEELDPVTRAQLLQGRWDVVPEGEMFKRQWFPLIDIRPQHTGLRLVRFWDLAATKPRKGTDPDWTVGVLLGLLDGAWYVLDVVRLRDTPKVVEETVLATAALDGYRVPIRMEQEPGSSGVNTVDHYARLLVGYDFQGVKTTGSKLERAKPLSSAAQRGHVSVLRASWTTAYLDELCAFPTEGVHDDQVDATSGAQGALAVAWPSLKDLPKPPSDRRFAETTGESAWDEDDDGYHAAGGRRF